MSVNDLRVQFLRGSRNQNDAYTGADGELTIDTSKKLVRIHDGVTQGGFAVGDYMQWGVGTMVNPARQAVEGGSYDFYKPQKSGFYRIGGGPSNRPAEDGVFPHPSGSTLIELAWGGGGDPDSNPYPNPEVYTDSSGEEIAAGNRNLLLMGGGNPDANRKGPQLWQYCENFGTRSRWVHYFNNENIVGNVAQIGGRPTRSVIEQGENSNGRYVRFADGTQICSNRIYIPNITDPSTYPAGVEIAYRQGDRGVVLGDTSFWFKTNPAATFIDDLMTTTQAFINAPGTWYMPRIGGTVGTFGPIIFFNSAGITAHEIIIEVRAEGRWY